TVWLFDSDRGSYRVQKFELNSASEFFLRVFLEIQRRIYHMSSRYTVRNGIRGTTMTESSSEGLEPIPDDERSMSLSHYIAVWWASFIIVQGFATAFFAVYPQGPLNVVQAGAAMTIGAVTSAVFFVLNGRWGYDEGIPFVAQARAAFGTRGAVVPNVVR